MKLCGRCGTQNLDHQAACTACGLALPAAPNPNFGGTLVMPPAAPPGLSPLAATALGPAPAAPAPAPAAAPMNLKGTMIGMAPPTFNSPATQGTSPPAAASQPPPPANQVPPRNFSGTMIGMAPPSYPPAAAAPAADTLPQSPPSTGAPRLASAQRTMVGVARPGIAPLNPGQAKAPTASDRPPAAAPMAPHWPARAPGADEASAEAALSPPRARPRRVSVTATLAIVGSAMLLVMAVLAFLMLRGHGSVTARASLDAKGAEQLELSCAECPDGTRTWIDAAPVTFQANKATLRLQAPLKVGENPLLLVLERPGRSREEIALSIPIEFRVRGSTDELGQEAPKVSVLASALSGAKLEVDGKPVTSEGAGAVRFDYDVASELTGAEASVKTLERVVPYKATSASGVVQKGQVEIRIGVTPLIVDAPGALIVVDSKEIVIAGRTAPGSSLKVGANSVSLDPEGRFASKQALNPGENKLVVRATLKDHAPRLVLVNVRRSDNLEREAALARAMAQASYPEVLRLGEGALGRSVALEGQVFDVRHDGYSSVVLVDVKNGCKKGPCLAKVVFGVEARLEQGRALKAFGKVVRFVDGPRTGQRIPEIRAELLVPGAP